MTLTTYRLRSLTLAVAALLIASCFGASGTSTSDSGTTDDGTTDTDTTDDGTSDASGGIVGADGTALSQLDTNDPLYLSLTGLSANSPYSVSVSAPDGSSLSPTGGFIATTDEDGSIPTSTLLQDLSTTSDGSSLVLWSSTPEPRITAQEGEYTIVVSDEDGTEVFTDTFTVIDDDKIFCADSDGLGRASFTPSESVYARIEKGDDGSLSDGAYTCYVFTDLGTALENNDTLTGTSFTVTVSGGEGQTSMGSFSVGTNALPSQYDVVCDTNANGTYDAGTDLLARPGRFRPCFTVQNANSGTDIIGQVCSDYQGNYRDVFDPNADEANIRNMFAWISPLEQSLVEHAIGVRKYVVEHQDSYADGDPLNDVTGNSSASAYEVDSVQGFCTNEAPWLVWPRERMVAGCYDCVIDVDADGTYDVGTDFVDNIDNNGEATCGTRVADTACAAEAVVITSHEDGATTTATAITLAGTVSGTTDSAFVTVASGSQTTTIKIDASGGSFSATIPLYYGENLITVTAVTGDSACADTIAVTASSESSSSELFRAQLTWDGSTDMDLHVVKPAGSYSNQGNGDGSDCNYGNCAVGIEGTGTNSLDWGSSGEDDDPKLDVDCVSCGNGIENIWMNALADDGDYKVYVDAYSGSETAVNVAISIRGSTVGTVSCGEMSTGTATDTCFVGTISWDGGNSGSGTFTAAGTKAADY